MLPLRTCVTAATEFSREDEEAAEWHHLMAAESGYPQPEDGWWEQAYDISDGCGTCGFRGHQIAPLRFESEPKVRRHFLGLILVYDAVFVRDEVKELFERERVTGIRFSRPLRHSTGAPLESIWQMEVEARLPPGLVADSLAFEVCEDVTDPSGRAFLVKNRSRLVEGPWCGRRKHNYPRRGAMTLHRVALAGAPDVVQTFEAFGSGGQSEWPVLVSSRVWRLIDAHRLRGAVLRPVALV